MFYDFLVHLCCADECILVTFTGDTSGLRGALVSVQLPSSTKETLSSTDPDDSSLGFSMCLQFSVAVQCLCHFRLEALASCHCQ